MSSYRGPRSPLGGPLGLAILVMFVVPELIKQCKPFAKIVGDTIVKVGEGVQKLAGTEDDAKTPNEEVKSSPTAPSAVPPDAAGQESAPAPQVVATGTEEVELETVTPPGRDEILSEIAAEAKGDREVPAPPRKQGTRKKTLPHAEPPASSAEKA